MKFIQYINEQIVKKTADTENLVLFGQNIAAGSCLSGLTQNLKVGKGGLIVNTPNVENTLAGIGFGMMLQGTSSIFFMKQLDFLLLGIDQLVHAYNFIRRKKPQASYTIFPIISDLGYHGLQSSFNNFGDICSVARIPGFTMTNKADAEAIISAHLVSPGFRIMGVPQRLFAGDILEPSVLYSNADKTLFQYSAGNNATIACFNFSLPYGVELEKKLKENNIDTSLFSINSVTPMAWDKIIEDVNKTKHLVIIDDSKSENTSRDNFLTEVLQHCKVHKTVVVKREFKGSGWLFPNDDLLSIDYDKIARALA